MVEEKMSEVFSVQYVEQHPELVERAAKLAEQEQASRELSTTNLPALVPRAEKPPTFIRRKLEEVNTKCNEALSILKNGKEMSDTVEAYVIKELSRETDFMKVQKLMQRVVAMGKELERIEGKISYIRDQSQLLQDNLNPEEK